MTHEYNNFPIDPVERVDHNIVSDELRKQVFNKNMDLKESLYNEVVIQERIDPLVVADLVGISGYIEGTHALSEDDVQRIRSYFVSGCCVALSLFDIIADNERLELNDIRDTDFADIHIPILKDGDRKAQMRVMTKNIIQFSGSTLQSIPFVYRTLIDDIAGDDTLDSSYAQNIRLGFGFTYGLRVRNLREAMFDASNELESVNWEELLKS